MFCPFLFFLLYDEEYSARPYADKLCSFSLCCFYTFLQELLDDKTYTFHPFPRHLQKDRSHRQNCSMQHLKNRIWIYNSFLVVARIFVPSSLRRSLIFSSILVISFYFLFFSYLLQFKSFLFLWKSFMLFIHQKT